MLNLIICVLLVCTSFMCGKAVTKKKCHCATCKCEGK